MSALGATRVRRANQRGRARLGELLVWDGILLGLVVALYVADRALPARAATPSPGTPRPPAATPDPAEPPPAKPPPREPARPLRGPRRASDGGGELEAAGKAAREHLAAGRLDEAVAALDAVPATARGTPEERTLRGEVLGEVVRRSEAVAALPRLQAQIDLGRLSGLETELAGMPDSPERERLRADLEAARKRPAPASGAGGEFQVSEFRPGWGATRGQRVSVESGLPPDDARALVEELDGLLSLAADLRGDAPPALTLTVHEAGGASGRAPATWRRAGEPREALLARARWVLASTLAERWRLSAAPAWVGAGLPAALATAGATGGARPTQTAAGRALRPHFLARALRVDGSERTTLLAASGSVDPVRAWGLATFAASSDPAAKPVREALVGALRGGASAPPSLPPDRAAALEGAWQAFLERP